MWSFVVGSRRRTHTCPDPWANTNVLAAVNTLRGFANRVYVENIEMVLKQLAFAPLSHCALYEPGTNTCSGCTKSAGVS